jgi:hypothetical protein
VQKELAKHPEGPAGDSELNGGSRNINRFRAARSEIAALGLMHVSRSVVFPRARKDQAIFFNLNCESTFAEQWDWKNLEFRLYALKRNSFALKESTANHILAHISPHYVSGCFLNDGGEERCGTNRVGTKAISH